MQRNTRVNQLTCIDPLPTRVLATLAGGEAGYPTLEQMAQRMCVSVRTLKRRLQRQGLSYRTLLDQLRLARATHLLGQPQLTAEKIGIALGYSSPANFARAFRRWTGSSPGVFRQTLAASCEPLPEPIAGNPWREITRQHIDPPRAAPPEPPPAL